MKVNSALASMFLVGEVTCKRKSAVLLVDTSRVTGTASKPGNGTSRSSSGGRGGGRSWRDVEAGAEVRLMILAQFRLLMYLRRLEE